MKYYSLHYFRGIFAFTVLIFHLGHEELFNFSKFFQNIIHYGELGVQGFFVISGYVISASITKYFTNELATLCFFLNRILRLYPAFIFSLLFTITINYINNHYLISLADLFFTFILQYNLFNYQSPQVPYWSLTHEFYFYIFYAILLIPLLKNHFFIWVRLSFLIVPLYLFGILNNHIANSTLPAHYFEFCLGILVYLVTSKKQTIDIIIYISFFVIGFLVNNYRLNFAIFISVIFLLMIFFENNFIFLKSKFFKPFNFLGTISYSIYIIHIPCILIIEMIFTWFEIEFSYIQWAISIAFTILTSTASFYYFEKPYLNYKFFETSVYKKLVKYQSIK